MRVRKIVKSNYKLRHVCPSVCPSAWKKFSSYRAHFRENLSSSSFIRIWQEYRLLYMQTYAYWR